MSEVRKIEQTETGYAWFFERTVEHMRKIDTGQKYPGEDRICEKAGESGHESTKAAAEASLETAMTNVRQKTP